MPRKPSTTDGTPPSTSTIGFKILRSQRGATSAMKIAVPTPIGTAINRGPEGDDQRAADQRQQAVIHFNRIPARAEQIA